ncbi:MAG TPA: peptidylprolyl isomerase [bacterium]|nr:peptidylprolyl isomerase [bacterium]
MQRVFMLSLLGVLVVLPVRVAAAPTAAHDPAESEVHEMSAPQAATNTAPQNPIAIIHTTAGDMRCELYPGKAPLAVANFIGLATGDKDWTNPATGKIEHHRPMYDGVIFHRVIPGFMIQGGDPLGTGTGGPGYKFQDELHTDLLFDRPGRLAMANAGPNTNGSQFFITEEAQPGLNPQNGAGYTIFGQCDDKAVALVKKIARMPRDARDRPLQPVKIVHIEIVKPVKSN